MSGFSTECFSLGGKVCKICQSERRCVSFSLTCWKMELGKDSVFVGYQGVKSLSRGQRSL